MSFSMTKSMKNRTDKEKVMKNDDSMLKYKGKIWDYDKFDKTLSFLVKKHNKVCIQNTKKATGIKSMAYTKRKQKFLFAGIYFLQFLQKFLCRFRQYLIFFPDDTHVTFHWGLKRSKTQMAISWNIDKFIKAYCIS